MHSAFSAKFFSVLLALSLGLASSGAWAADAPATTTEPRLDNDEMAQLQKARQQVLAANPDLQAEEVRLKNLHDAQTATPATPEQRNAIFAEWKAYQKKMRAAMLKVDPTLGPVFVKLDDARKHGASSPFQPAAAK
jgi:hypothetical protein